MTWTPPNGNGNAGGFGEPNAPRRTAPRSFGDERLWQRPLRERWPVPQSKRPAIVNAMIAIIEDPNSSARAKTAAARALLQASKINLDSVRTAAFVRRLAGANDVREAALEDSKTLREFFDETVRLAKLEEESLDGRIDIG